MPASNGKVKVTVNLTQDEVDKLKAIAEEKGVTVTDVLRRAIATESFLQDAKTDGSKILIEDNDKKVRQVVIP